MGNSWTFGAHLPEDTTLDSPESPGLPEIGEFFGCYRIAGTLGEGAHGVVYRAQDRAGREVALKVLKGRLDETHRERFRREGEVAASLEHDGIVRVLGGGEQDGQPYLVYELVEGARELDHYLRGQELAGRVGALLRVAEALGYAHERGVTHRDLKASNVLVDSAGQARVADFGLAKTQGGQRLTLTGAILGTPVAMAPEQIVSDLKSVGPATDVWALGVMLYEAICDELPFEADTFPELQARVVASEPKRPGTIVPGLSPELEAVCLKALAKDPSRRYVDGAALGSDLRRYLAGEPSLAGRRATGGTLRLLPLAAFAVALACVGLTLAILSKEDERPSGASDGTSSVTTVVMGTPAEEHGTVTSGPLKGPLRFLPELRAELLSPPLDVSEVNRLEAWRAMFAAGSWVELGRRLDPTRQSLLKFLAADAARDPGQYDRWALACLLNAWEQGDQRGLFYLGSWIVAKAKNSKSVQQGFDLIRHCASRPRSAPNLGWSADALYLSKVYTQQFQRGLEPNPKLAAAWLCIAQAGGLSRSGKHYREQVTVVRQVTKTLAKSTEQAWDWIAEEEQQLGRTPNPRLLEDGVLAVPSARERVARLASVNADADLAKLRELGKRSPLVYERLQEIERVGSPSALFRLSTLIVNDHPELSFRLCLRAAVAGKRAACRALRWHESCRTKPVADAWIELGSHGTPADRDRAWAVIAKWLASNPPGR